MQAVSFIEERYGLPYSVCLLAEVDRGFELCLLFPNPCCLGRCHCFFAVVSQSIAEMRLQCENSRVDPNLDVVTPALIVMPR